MKKVSIIIIVLFSISGCNKIYCPKFPTNINYFPYYEEQELRFMNTQDVIRSFIITNKEDSKSESFAWNCDCACEISSNFSTNENQDSLGIRVAYLRLYDGEYVSSINIGFNFQYSCLYGEYLEKKIVLDSPVLYNEIYKYLEEIITIENEQNQLVKKLVIIKGKGLVSYTTADGEEWKLVE